ncbi:MAG: c-type cytochrome biogenesis protein CcsB [Sporichthyaceae bacterium]
MIDQDLALASDRLIWFSIGVYALAMIALLAEWAFGGRAIAEQAAAVPAVRELATVGGPSATRSLDVPSVPAGPFAIGRAERIGRIGLTLTWLAFALHFGSVLTRGLAVDRAPWGNMYEFSSAAALAGMAVFLGLSRRHDVRWLGVFVVGPALLTLGIAVTVLYTDAVQLQPALQSVWLVIHVIAAATSGGIFTVGAAISLLYLAAEKAERTGSTSRLAARLPSAKKLDRLGYQVHAFVFPLWTFAVIAGAIWAENAWGRYWGWDPKETWAFITWVVYAAYLHARATAGWKGRKAAYVALLGFATFLFNYFAINLLVTGLHSYAGV